MKQARKISGNGEYGLLAAMLLLLHFAVWWDFGAAFSQALMLVHFGLFLIWQPFWSRRERVHWGQGVAFLGLTVGLTYWLDRWLLSGWVILLTGIIAGLPGTDRRDRYVYFPALLFLVSTLVLGCVPPLFQLTPLPETVTTLFEFGLFAAPVAIGIIAIGTQRHSGSRSIDLFRAVTISLLTAVLAASSLVDMYFTGTDYPVALVRSLLAIAGFLFAISWLLSPQSYAGLTQLWEQSLLNIGTPFEQWLVGIANLADAGSPPEEFLRDAMYRVVALPWCEGVEWHDALNSGAVGREAPYRLELQGAGLSVTLLTRKPVGPGLLVHCRLLIQIVQYFYLAKLRETELAQKAHLEAIYQTGARVAHDIKNLLQSLRSVAGALETQGPGARRQRAQDLVRRQVPSIIQRLERALGKLQAPERSDQERCDLACWWDEIKARHALHEVEFESQLGVNPQVPRDLLDSVVDNLLENAYHKRRTERRTRIQVSVSCGPGGLYLTVCDSGSAIHRDLAAQLLRQPVASASGMGVGLYQIARQAQIMGYALALTRNAAGEVCFTLSGPAEWVAANTIGTPAT